MQVGRGVLIGQHAYTDKWQLAVTELTDGLHSITKTNQLHVQCVGMLGPNSYLNIFRYKGRLHMANISGISGTYALIFT